MSNQLSPAAQAIMCAVDALYDYGCPSDKEFIAAALRAAVSNYEFAEVSVGKTVAVVRVDTILNIAAELERLQQLEEQQ